MSSGVGYYVVSVQEAKAVGGPYPLCVAERAARNISVMDRSRSYRVIEMGPGCTEKELQSKIDEMVAKGAA